MSDWDSDQQILDHTHKADGKWTFMLDGQLIAQADAPEAVTMEVATTWCEAVRARLRSMSELDTEEILARRERRRQGNLPSPPAERDIPETPEAEPVVDTDDVDAFVAAKVSAMRTRREELEAELAILVPRLEKWEKLL